MRWTTMGQCDLSCDSTSHVWVNQAFTLASIYPAAMSTQDDFNHYAMLILLCDFILRPTQMNPVLIIEIKIF